MENASWYSLPFAASPWWVQLIVMVLFAAIVWAMVWWFIVKQAESTGLSFSGDIWPAIKDNPIAVVLYRLGIYALAVAIAAVAFSRFA